MVSIKNVMRKAVVTVDPATSISNVAKILTNNKVGSAVVVSGKKPIGIVTADDIVQLAAKGEDLKKTKVKDLKAGKLVSAKPSDNMLDVMKRMVKVGVKRMPVIDGSKLVGIVTEKELLLAAPELIEVLSEKLKARIGEVAEADNAITGMCEKCGNFSDDLRHSEGRWFCEDCREDDVIGEDSEDKY